MHELNHVRERDIHVVESTTFVLLKLAKGMDRVLSWYPITVVLVYLRCIYGRANIM